MPIRKIQEFGIHATNYFPCKEFGLIRLRGYDYLDQLRVDDSIIGGYGGQDCGGFELADGEFINYVEIHWGTWIDKLIIGTNKSAPIAAGGTGGPNRITLANVHVYKFGGSWGSTHNMDLAFSIEIEWEQL